MNDLNMAPCADPVDVLVLSGLPQNVDTVIADGRILKRGGKLIAADVEQIAAETCDSVTRMLELAGWEFPPALRNMLVSPRVAALQVELGALGGRREQTKTDGS
jgi:hypothetical protein